MARIPSQKCFRLGAVTAIAIVANPRKKRAMDVMIQTLASAPSALPTDASALEASISALKSSVSALESSLKTLEGSSGCWETLAWSCAFAVGVGIVGEIVVIVCEYDDDRDDWRRGIVRPPDHPSVWRFWFDIIATLLVLGGVFGEAGASMKLASINSQLRSKTSELRAKSDQLLALVTQEAGSAASSATKAQDSLGKVETEARGAQEASSNALTLAQDAHKEADVFEKEISAARNDLAVLQQNVAAVSERQSARIIDPVKFAKAMQGKPKKTAELLYNPNDPEAYFFAEQIRDCLGYGFKGSGAGWDVSEPRPIPPTGGNERFPNAPPQVRYGTLAGAGITFVFRDKKAMKDDDRSALQGLEFAITGSSSRRLPVAFAEREDSTLPEATFIVVIGHEM